MENKPSAGKKRSGMRVLLFLFYMLPVLFVLVVLGYLGYNWFTHRPPPVRKISTKAFATVKINDLTASLYGQDSALQASGNDVFIEFRDAKAKLVDVGEVTFELDLQMPGTIMHSIGKVFRTATPGQYRTTVEPQVAGEWTANLKIAGPQGNAEVTLPVKVM